MRRLFSRLFISFLGVALFILFFVLAFFIVVFTHSARQWSNIAFDEYTKDLASTISDDMNGLAIEDFIEKALISASQDNRISGLIIKDLNNKNIFSFGKTQIGENLLGGKDDFTFDREITLLKEETNTNAVYENVVINSPINLIQFSTVTNQNFVDLIRMNASNSLFDKRVVEVPQGVNSDSITGSIFVYEDDTLLYEIDVLIFTPTTYKYSKDIFSVSSLWITAIIMIAIQFSLLLSFYFSKQLESYANGLKVALHELSKGKENVDLPYYNVEEYNQINKAIKLLDNDLSQNRKNRKAWLRNITHDLNTPITSMQILLDGVEDKIFPLNDETVSMLKQEHNHLSKRVNRVVLYASLQSPEKEIEISYCSSRDIINSLNKNDINFERVNFIEEDNCVIADFSTIVLALTCLIENALEYGVSDVDVILSKYEIKVSNIGKIKNDNAIFEPWERGDESRTAGGNGLGLPIVYEVMKLHSGTIKIQNSNNKVIAIMKWQKLLK